MTLAQKRQCPLSNYRLPSHKVKGGNFHGCILLVDKLLPAVNFIRTPVDMQHIFLT